MKILAFGASSSKNSINQKLAAHAASLVKNAEVELLDLNDYELPLFNVDREAELGPQDLAKQFLAKIAGADAVIISFAEHNGNYTAAYKNLLDWVTRVEKEFFQNIPLYFLSTSPGQAGASSVLNIAATSAKFFAGNLKGTMSVPSFNENFDLEKSEISNLEIKNRLIRDLQLIT